MKNKRFIYGIAGSLILAAVLFFIFLPPINPTSIAFWIYLWVSLIPLLIAVIANMTKKTNVKKEQGILGVFAASIAIVLVIMFVCSPIFNANEYAQRIDLVEADFSEIDEVDFTKTAIIDRDSTMVLGDRTLGQLPELISQFEVSDIYSQISYQDTIVRVTPLDYNGLIKYFSNHSEGIPGYIIVNATTGKSDLVKLEDLGLSGIKYSENAILFESVPDFSDNSKAVFDEISNVAKPFLKHMLLGVVRIQDSLGKKGIENAKPFYKKLFYKIPESK